MTAIVGKVVFVKYVGLKERKADNVGKTGLTWTKGQIHAVPAALAVPLLQYPGVWQAASEADFADPINLGECADPDIMVVEETDEQRELREEEEEEALAQLPNLAPLNKQSIAQYAKRNFGLDLDVSTLKKEEMLSIVRTTANSRAAFTKLDKPGEIIVPPPVPGSIVEVPRLVAQGEVTFGDDPVVVQGFVDAEELARAAVARGEMPQLVPSPAEAPASEAAPDAQDAEAAPDAEDDAAADDSDAAKAAEA